MATWVAAPLPTSWNQVDTEAITAYMPAIPAILNQPFNPVPASGSNTDGTDAYSSS